MSVIEAVKGYKSGTKINKINKNNVTKAAVRHICCFLLGLFFSLAGFNEDFSPFGIAFAASVSKSFTLTATLGAVLGYFLSLSSVSALRYTSSILSLCVIMTALKSFKNIRDNVVTPVAVSFVCLFVTGLAVVASKNITLYSFLLCFSESVIGGAAALAFSKSRLTLLSYGGISCATSKDVTSVIISITLLLLSIGKYSFFNFYPAQILGFVLVLISAYYGKEAGGAIVGLCTGITMSISTGNVNLMVVYSLGGLLSGAMSSFGKISAFLSFFFSSLAVCAVLYKELPLIPLTAEVIFSGGVFLFVTQRYNKKLEKILLPTVTSPVIDSVKGGIIKKLKNAANYSAEICSSLNTVNDALSKTDRITASSIPKKVKEKVCGSCGLYDVCWGESQNETKINFEALLNLKKEGVYLEYKTVPQNVASSCIRTESVSSCFNRLYSQYKLQEQNEARLNEIHSLASFQFHNVSALLDSVCEDISQDSVFDMDVATKARALAGNCGLEPFESCCVINNMGKMFLEIKVKKPCEKQSLKPLGHQFEVLTGRPFELPIIDDYDGYLKLTYKEKSDLKVISAGIQFNSNGEKYCGDSFTTFEDDDGYFYAAICDGMGTGSKAAISSNFAITLLEKLIKAGFGVIPSINTVNTSLISKSGEEGSATLDLVVIDLYTGSTEFYKCGASDTVVKRKNKIVDVGFDSLPLGILKDAEAERGTGTLYPGDVVVMCSDGVREEDYYALRNAVKGFGGGNVRNFTTEISEKIRRTQPQKNDDMTVLTIAITGNN